MKKSIITIIAVLLSLTIGNAADLFKIESITLKPGEIKDIVFSLSQDKEKYAGVQFDIKLPTGLSLGLLDNNGVYYSLASNQPDDLTCTIECTETNGYRFMVYSNSLKLLTSGELLTLRISASKDVALKDYSLKMNNVMLSDTDGVVTKLGNSTYTVKVTDFFTLIYNVDGTEYKSIVYEYGASITPESSLVKEGYTFSGWSKIPSTMPAKDVTVTGKFTVNKYKLVYKVDDVTYRTFDVNYGTTIAPIAEPTKEGYTFSGWSKIPSSMPAKDVTITGKFAINKYKIEYKVDDVTYRTFDVNYGTTIAPIAEPTKVGYTFSGWSEIPATMPAKDMTVTGTFTINKYKLTYMVDGVEYKSLDVEYSAAVTSEAEPTKEGYTFSGWSEIPTTMPAKDVAVTGTFTVNKYKLTYMVDGVEYKSIDVDYGVAVTTEAEPTKEGYTFSGWSWIPSTMPAHDVTVTGTFAVNKYKLTYMLDDVEYKSYDIEYSSTITTEAEPIREGYTFSGWSEIPSMMPAHDVTVTGTFAVNKYKITYMLDGVEYKSYEMAYGLDITSESSPSKEGYTFSGWSWIPSTMPAENITVIGTFTINTYKLTYEVDGVEYSIYDVTYGATVNPESEPTKEGYSFSGWSNLPGTMPARDVIVTGWFTVNKYKLIYMVDEEVYKTLEVEYGAAIVPELMPQKENHTFSGWSEIPATMPAKDVTITGSFTYVPPTEYTITYMVDGEVYKTVNFYEGETVIKEEEPTKEGYTFSGWSWIPSTMPSENMTVAGTFKVNTYKLNYIVDGTEYMSFDVEYGKIISPEKEPTKEGYNFSGWSDLPETMPAKDVTVVGTFTQKEMFSENGISYEVLANNTVAVIDGNSVSGKIEIPETVIHDGMFYIVSSIEENAFKDNKNLTELTISKYVSSIGAFAFEGCVGLKVIICHLENPLDIDDPAVAESSSVFAGLDKENCVLCVPESSVELYKAAAGWRDFKNIVSISYYVGVEDVNLENQDVQIYDLQGNRLNKMHKGINVIRLKNGTSKTVLLK